MAYITHASDVLMSANLPGYGRMGWKFLCRMSNGEHSFVVLIYNKTKREFGARKEAGIGGLGKAILHPAILAIPLEPIDRHRKHADALKSRLNGLQLSEATAASIKYGRTYG